MSRLAVLACALVGGMSLGVAGAFAEQSSRPADVSAVLSSSFISLPSRCNCGITHIASAPQAIANSQSLNRLSMLEGRAERRRTIEDAYRRGQATFRLVGDGKTTSHARLVVTNRSQEDLRLTVPAGEFFDPQQQGVQVMMATHAVNMDVAAGQTVSSELRTLCSSPLTFAPPTDKGNDYVPKSSSRLSSSASFCGILDAADQIDKEGGYSALPIPGDRRVDEVRQLAIWKEFGDQTPDPSDDLTEDVLKKRVLDQMKDKGKPLSETETKDVDNRVKQIFDAVDLTVKRARQKGVVVGKGEHHLDNLTHQSK